jgi:hypothetical protein
MMLYQDDVGSRGRSGQWFKRNQLRGLGHQYGDVSVSLLNSAAP